MSWTTKEIVDQLAKVVEPSRIKIDADDLQFYGNDWSNLNKPNPCAIVFPTSIKEVQAVVGLANKLNFPLVPSGGRTGLSGGALAKDRELVVSFDLMNKILGFNKSDALVTCQPGVVTRVLKDFAESKGLFYPVDFASVGSSQVGGNAATNAGGVNVLRYGMTRDWIEGIKVVTGTGELLDLNRGLKKNATGFDFRHLFIGSEGTLGLIVELTVELTNPPKGLNVMLMGLKNIEHTTQALAVFKEKLDLTAFEFFSDIAMKKVLERKKLRNPFDHIYPFYVLVEFESYSEVQLNAASELFERCIDSGYAVDGVVSQNQRQVRELWEFREGITESIASYKPFKSDVSCRISQTPAFLCNLEEILNGFDPKIEAVLFGHLGDGNIHINLLKPNQMDSDDFREVCRVISKSIFDLVKSFGGSISAEHGIGLTKKPYLNYSRNEVELDYMRGVKRLFDPNNIMNPGKLIDI